MQSRAWALLVALQAPAAGCEPKRDAASVVAAPEAPAADPFADDARPLPRYHSKRLALTLPLPRAPRGRGWRIDDHTRPELVATLDGARTRVTAAVFHTDDVVGRAQCESMARARGIVPAGDLRTLEDEVSVTQGSFDTRVWVSIEPGDAPGRTLAGHVVAFGGYLRKCFAFVFSTEVAGVAEEGLLSSRLAFARARILGGMRLDVFDAPPRPQPDHETKEDR
ncbi:MAG TPA: hypothetical protein VGM06_22645 [Polyangiaceae bacterium]|jgi:hypothetical protein